MGTISTNGTEFGSDSFMPEITKTHVLFRCRTAAVLTPVYTCKTYVFGQWNSQVSTGSLFTTTEVKVLLAASGSGLTAVLNLVTTDSNGGSCNWTAILWHTIFQSLPAT